MTKKEQEIVYDLYKDDIDSIVKYGDHTFDEVIDVFSKTNRSTQAISLYRLGLATKELRAAFEGVGEKITNAITSAMETIRKNN